MLKRLVATTVTLACLSMLGACGDDDGDTRAVEPAALETADPPVPCDYVEDGSQPVKPAEPPPNEAKIAGSVPVTFETNLGDITATLDADAAPCTVNSFISLAEQGFFDQTPCPRMVASDSFGILQCGDPSGTGTGGPGYQFADELSGQETYVAGTLAMANGGPNTNSSQFFFVFNEAPDLPPSYNVFGQFDEAAITLLRDAAADGDDGSHPAGGGVPNSGPIDIISVTIG